MNSKIKKLNSSKTAILIVFAIFSTLTFAQEMKPIPMINVAGEGKIKATPDEVCITISQETTGEKAIEVKKENDAKMDAVIKFIKKMNIPQGDYLTQRVTLNPNYDYEAKKHTYIAVQTVAISLKDLSKYDTLMNGLVEVGINRIESVEFKSSKILQLQSDARKLAIKDAKMKAEDFVSVLGQKVGKAFTISDNSQNTNPHPVLYAMKSTGMDASGGPKETLAAGEIEIVVNVNISFLLE
jgi:uncharacterized protein